MRQVLIFSYAFPSLGGGGVQRTLKFARRFNESVPEFKPGTPPELPAKLYEYHASGRPIVRLVDPDQPGSNDLEAKAGWVVHSRDEAGIATAVEELHQSWRAGDLDESRPIPRELLRSREQSELTGRLAAVFDGVVR